MLTAYELVQTSYRLPYPLYPFQIDAVNELAPLPRASYWLDTGTGKTITSITSALYKLLKGSIDNVIVLMPPILITNWGRTLSAIKGVTWTAYKGTPAVRGKLGLNVNFILMSYEIFRMDNAKLFDHFANKTTLIIADESTKIKNVGTKSFKMVRDWHANSHLMLLSGTPISNPADGYAPVKLVAPLIYRNLNQFENLFIKSRDFFNNPKEWHNLDLLHENLMCHAVRVLKTDVLKDLPPVTYNPVYYEMDKGHTRTYETLCEEQILKFDDGTKLDATQATRLFHALQQIPMNRETFTQEEGVMSMGVELIEEILEELEPRGKLVIFTAYKATNRMLIKHLEKYGVVAVFGEISAAQQQRNIDLFVESKKCRVILLQLQSASFGLDKLQTVCNDALFVEMPMTPSQFHQAVARLWRIGQSSPVNVRVAIAERTIQVRLWEVLQDKDSLVNVCIRGYDDLKKALKGNNVTI